MKILAAIDSFKGSLSSVEAGKIVKKSALNVNDDIDFKIKPIADGGEGTVDSFLSLKNSKKIELTVNDPLMRKTKAYYATIDDLAIMEMSQAAGLTKLKDDEKNPMLTSTFGVGQMINHALENGIRRFIIGIGGSATNDCGLGMLKALGCNFLDKNNKEVGICADAIKDIHSIDIKYINPKLKECDIKIASDVDNPLYGKNGASFVYAAQKGADDQMIKVLDDYLRYFAKKTSEIIDNDPNYPGCGAAGGLGFAFKYYLNAKLQKGIDIVFKELEIEESIKESDLIITGEGKMDRQTSMGKVISGIGKLSKKYDKKAIAFCGSFEKEALNIHDIGIDAIFSIQKEAVDLKKAMDKEYAKENLYLCALEVFKLINTYGGI